MLLLPTAFPFGLDLGGRICFLQNTSLSRRVHPQEHFVAAFGWRRTTHGLCPAGVEYQEHGNSRLPCRARGGGREGIWCAE